MDKQELMKRMDELRWFIANQMAVRSIDPAFLNTVDHAITALTQDRAADDERVRHIAQYAVRAAGCSQAMSEHLVQSICQHFKTPPAQAEPKDRRRRDRHYQGPTRRKAARRNPAEADRRKSDKGYQARPPHGMSSSRGGHTYYGRRAGDRARWVVCEACDANAGCNATPPSQPAAEVSESLADWVLKMHPRSHLTQQTTIRQTIYADDLLNFAKKIDRELDKRGVKP